MKKKVIFFVIFFSFLAFPQSKRYLLVYGRNYSETQYIQLKDSLSKHGKISDEIKGSYKKNDTLYIFTNLKMDSANTSHSYFDLKRFNESFFKEKVNFTELPEIAGNKKIDNTKPYLINCWFIKCGPCRGEIPELNNIEQKYRGQFNFVAITFDKKEDVEKFLQKQNFNFMQLANEQKLLDKMNVNTFPTSFVLDKEGNFIDFVYLQFPHQEEKLKKIAEKLLKN